MASQAGRRNLCSHHHRHVHCKYQIPINLSSQSLEPVANKMLMVPEDVPLLERMDYALDTPWQPHTNTKLNFKVLALQPLPLNQAWHIGTTSLPQPLALQATRLLTASSFYMTITLKLTSPISSPPSCHVDPTTKHLQDIQDSSSILSSRPRPAS